MIPRPRRDCESLWTRLACCVYIVFAMVRTLALTLLLPLVAPLVACNKDKLIPNTPLKDTKLNREIVRVLERYRRAMEKRDAATILSMVHPTYQDNSGGTEAQYDLDFERVKGFLVDKFKRATRVRFRIEYQRLTSRGREAKVDTWIDATFVYEHPGAPPRWRRYTDYNRYTLLKDGPTWRFISGL